MGRAVVWCRRPAGSRANTHSSSVPGETSARSGGPPPSQLPAKRALADRSLSKGASKLQRRPRPADELFLEKLSSQMNRPTSGGGGPPPQVGRPMERKLAAALLARDWRTRSGGRAGTRGSAGRPRARPAAARTHPSDATEANCRPTSAPTVAVGRPAFPTERAPRISLDSWPSPAANEPAGVCIYIFANDKFDFERSFAALSLGRLDLLDFRAERARPARLCGRRARFVAPNEGDSSGSSRALIKCSPRIISARISSSAKNRPPHLCVGGARRAREDAAPREPGRD
jgi:hypothetical protein